MVGQNENIINMSRNVRFFRDVLAVVGATFLLSSCGGGSGRPTSINPGGASTATGLAYNEDSSFQVKDFSGQPPAPNTVFIEGGRAVLGSFEEDVLGRRDNLERTVTVASFYMDETEIANVHWLEYEFYTEDSSDAFIEENVVLDEEVWARELAYNDPYVEHYLRYPGFRYFPVVGVSWKQAVAYSEWRTVAVNQKLMTEAAERGDWEPEEDEVDTIMVAGPEGSEIPKAVYKAGLASGVVLPNYRLPTEAEWQYAAQALIGTQWLDENQTHQRLYPWDGHALRNPYGREMGYFLANFKRGRGDYAGIAGKLNDGAMITSYIYEHPPNDFGLYNMAGNVNEWVLDLYRPLSYQDMDDLNPVRRNDFLDDEADYNLDEQLINNRSRVYKGGSWKDVAFWMSPGNRRYLDEDSSTATIGFRCAMIRAGSNY